MKTCRIRTQMENQFGNIVWENCGISLLNKLEKLQNRAARVLTYSYSVCSNYDVYASHLFKLFGWKNLSNQEQIQRVTMVYKSLYGLALEYLSSKIEMRANAYNLRDSENKLNVPLPRTNFYKNSFSYIIATSFGTASMCDVREAESQRQFKHLLKRDV